MMLYLNTMKGYTPDVTLASPLHDPEARLADSIRKHGKKIKTFYFGFVVVRATQDLHTDTKKALESCKIEYSLETKKSEYINMGRTYRGAMQMGIKLNTRSIHVCDFDRILHWIKSFPNELRDVIKLIPSNYGLTWIGRTERAFETHPRTQRKTESIVNTIASEKAEQDLDIMSGSFAMDINTAKLLLKNTKRNDYSFYSEFLVYALKKKIPVGSILTEGLEWETPDQYKDKIQKEGYQDWLDEFMSLPEWKRRIELLERNSDALTG